MTFQTTPYMPWIFPDQAYEMNRGGLQYSEFPSRSSFDPDVGTESPWAAHERQVAMDRVQNTHRAQLGMEGKINTTARSQRYDRPASRSAVPNGVFYGSPMDYSTSGNAFRGGRIYTKEGQEWLAQRLQERAQEYGEMATGNFSRGIPAQISLSQNTTTMLFFVKLLELLMIHFLLVNKLCLNFLNVFLVNKFVNTNLVLLVLNVNKLQ